MNYVILGILVVIVIGFFVAVWKAAGEWRWYNIVAVIVTMGLAVAFLFPTAGVLKSREAWHKVKEDLERRAAQEKAENRRLKLGPPGDPLSGEGVVSLSRQLAQLGIESGRIWRDLTKQSVNNGQVVLAKPPEQPAVPGIPGEPEPEPSQIPIVPAGLVVYAFLETSPNPQGQVGQPVQVDPQSLLPTFYLGEFFVVDSNAQQATLAPTTPLYDAQLQVINAQQAQFWSLYELLPTDQHEAFVTVGSSPSDGEPIGTVDTELVTKLIPEQLAETRKAYTEDGRRALPDDAPISLWTRVEFDQEHTVDVDGSVDAEAINGSYFDGNGRAIDIRLRQGSDDGQVKFATGDQIILKKEAADRLIEEGIAHLVNEYYLRPLNDYRFMLRHIRVRRNEVAGRIVELQEEYATLDTAVKKTDEMLVSNQQDQLKLEQDLEQFQRETLAIKAYGEQLRVEIADSRETLNKIHQKNIELARELQSFHNAIEQRDRQRSSPASSSDQGAAISGSAMRLTSRSGS